MCMVTRAAKVQSTRIFARIDGDEQILVYQNKLDLKEPAAMILPIPEATAQEDAVKFIDMESESEFFNFLSYRFPMSQTLGLDGFKKRRSAMKSAPLKVETVGAFKASYVPSQDDFERLDPQFKFDPAIWEKLPQYEDFGFVVFRFQAGHNKPHPMAFRFKTRHPEAIFFPTIHVHDGELHDKDDFDHILYTQANDGSFGQFETLDDKIVHDDLRLNWVSSESLKDNWEQESELGDRSKLKPAELFDSELPLWRKAVRGRLPNNDFYVELK